jgi:hypothetical protein
MSQRSVKTFYIVQPFSQALRGRLHADPPVSASDAAHALRLANRLAERKAGVVAFSRTGDPDLGELDDPIILARYGQLPPELCELASS